MADIPRPHCASLVISEESNAVIVMCKFQVEEVTHQWVLWLFVQLHNCCIRTGFQLALYLRRKYGYLVDIILTPYLMKRYQILQADLDSKVKQPTRFIFHIDIMSLPGNRSPLKFYQFQKER